jgi:2-polyprenyl-3-methyl-5-hydroxy-6-metoxy-1,4-benzoquinol methylase
MKINLEPTGERVIEDAYQHSLGAYTIYAMHGASYRFVQDLCTDKRVLDLGCGSGYGSHRIAAVAREVQGVDVAADAVAYAQQKYQHPGLSFRQIIAGQPLPFADGHFDVVLSFQVIEHVHDDNAYLLEAKRLLRPGGTLVVITPDRQHRLLPGQKPWNRWHLREYSMEQLCQRVQAHFTLTQALRMGADWPVAATEIRRYRRTKLLTLPATLPFVPEAMRVAALNLVHRVIDGSKQRSTSAPTPTAIDYGFDEKDFQISPNPPNALNLIIVAERS